MVAIILKLTCRLHGAILMDAALGSPGAKGIQCAPAHIGKFLKGSPQGATFICFTNRVKSFVSHHRIVFENLLSHVASSMAEIKGIY